MRTSIQQAMAAIREGTLPQFQQSLDEHPHLLAEHGAHMLEYAATNNRVDVLTFLIAEGST